MGKKLNTATHTIDDNGFRSFTAFHGFTENDVFQHVSTVGLHVNGVLAIGLLAQFLATNPEIVEINAVIAYAKKFLLAPAITRLRATYDGLTVEQRERLEKTARTLFDSDIFGDVTPVVQTADTTAPPVDTAPPVVQSAPPGVTTLTANSAIADTERRTIETVRAAVSAGIGHDNANVTTQLPPEKPRGKKRG
jgi:hypothetical protein